jgi:hypothetical protein
MPKDDGQQFSGEASCELAVQSPREKAIDEIIEIREAILRMRLLRRMVMTTDRYFVVDNYVWYVGVDLAKRIQNSVYAFEDLVEQIPQPAPFRFKIMMSRAYIVSSDPMHLNLVKEVR